MIPKRSVKASNRGGRVGQISPHVPCWQVVISSRETLDGVFEGKANEAQDAEHPKMIWVINSERTCGCEEDKDCCWYTLDVKQVPVDLVEPESKP